MNDLKAWRRFADRALADYRHAARSAKEEADALEKARLLADATAEAQRILQGVAAGVQAAAVRQVSKIVTSCIGAVFNDEDTHDGYGFDIRFEARRSKTEARLVFTKAGEEIDPLTAAGGGVVDVAAMALRLASLVLTRPRKRPVLILDEPFRMLSRNYAGRIRSLLCRLSDEMGIQIVMVTHDANLAAGKIVRIEDGEAVEDGGGG